MHRFRIVYGLLFAFLFLAPAAAIAQSNDAPTTRILFIFDGSGSMHGRWESGKKIDVAQKLMIQMLDSMQSLRLENLQLALRVYGHTKPSPPQDCDDTYLEVPFGNNTYLRIKRVLQSIIPKGTTPIARSLEYAAEDFTPCNNCRNIIILITDGIEECNGDPCAVSRALQRRGIALKPFVIGIGLDMEFRDTFECVGNYYDAANESTFKNVLSLVISQALNNTSAQVNLLDDNGRITETDVPLALYDNTTLQLKESFVHTLNLAGNPDTITLDPLVDYNLEVFTIPPVTLNNIDIVAGEHNVIEVNAGRGTLQLQAGNGRSEVAPSAIIRQHGSNRTIHVQQFNSKQKYLTGSYDLEILTLPRIYQNGIEIEQSTVTRIAIPSPGHLTLQSYSSGPGGIYVINGDKLEWVVDLDPEATRQSFELQPGNYRVIYRPSSAHSAIYSKSKAFNITSGNSTLVKIQ